MITTSGGPTYYVWVNWNVGPRVMRTDDGGATYSVNAPGFLAAGAALDPADPLRQFAVDSASPGTVFLTTDGGATWGHRARRGAAVLLRKELEALEAPSTFAGAAHSTFAGAAH